MTESLTDLSAHLKEKLGERLVDSTLAYGELTIKVDGDNIIEVLSFLKSDPQCRFVSIIDICGADYPQREKRFDVVYHLLSPRQNKRIRIKVETDEEPGKERTYVSNEGISTEVHLYSDGRFPTVPEFALGNLNVHYHGAGKFVLEAAAKQGEKDALKPAPDSSDNVGRADLYPAAVRRRPHSAGTRHPHFDGCTPFHV